MSGTPWIHLLSAASAVVVTLLAVLRGRGTRLGLPLTLLGADGFAWNAFSLGFDTTGQLAYAWLGAVAAPPYVAIIFHVIVVFVGKRQRLSRILAAAYLVSALQSVVAAFSFFPGSSVDLSTVSTLLLLGSAPLALVAVRLLVDHLRAAVGEVERSRTRVMLLALFAVTVLLVTDPLADLGLGVPRLAVFGGLVFNALLTYLALGLHLLPEGPPGLTSAGQAVTLSLFITAVYVSLFSAFKEQAGLFLASGFAITVVVAAVTTLLVLRSQRARTDRERFVTLGRFSAQMAHDLKNPLAAARGAAEFLAVEMRRDGQAERTDLATLLVDQLDRLGAVIERYQRLAGLTLERKPVDLNALVRRVLALHGFTREGASVALDARLGEGPLTVSADEDLLRSVVENLVKNALEAMPRGGTLTVTSELDTGSPPQARLSIRDSGVGMDPRAREQAFDLFFTTKATGSGLGLPFARAVIRAHGGEMTLTSREGEFTLVELWLPAQPAFSRGASLG